MSMKRVGTTPHFLQASKKFSNGLEEKGIRESQAGSLRYFNFFTSTFEFRPLCSYFSRRPGGKSSGVPSAKPPLD